MAISVRSQLISASAAMITVTAVTVSGVTAAGPDLPSAQVPALADVALTVRASPLLEIFDSIQKVNLYLFSIAEPPVTTFNRAGIIPDFLAAGFPMLSQYFLNAPDYVSQSLNYLFAEYQQAVAPAPSVYPGALRVLTWAAQALPANIALAAQQLFSGSLVGALQTLQFATINPIQAALYQTLNAGLYALGGVGVRAAAVITAVAEWIPTTIRNLADDVTVILNAAANIIGNVAFGIQNLNPEAVWNALVEGLLGTNPNPATPTLPDALINQTIGEGGRIYTAPGLPGYLEVPSIRQNLTELRDNITDALATAVPIPEDPPFPVTFLPNGSRIPTPWNPTPVVGPVAVAPAASTGSTALVPVKEPMVAVTSSNELAGVVEDAYPGKDRPARAGRGAQARADATGSSVDRPARQAGGRSAGD